MAGSAGSLFKKRVKTKNQSLRSGSIGTEALVSFLKKAASDVAHEGIMSWRRQKLCNQKIVHLRIVLGACFT